MKRLIISIPFIFSAVSILGVVVRADEAVLRDCVKRYQKSMGVSADLAFSECKKKSLGNCINNLLGTKHLLYPIRKTEDGYLYSMGDRDHWLDGPQWRSLGCEPVTKKFENSGQISDKIIHMYKEEWFKYGLCSSQELQTTREYTKAEAYEKCDLSYIKPNKSAPTNGPAAQRDAKRARLKRGAAKAMGNALRNMGQGGQPSSTYSNIGPGYQSRPDATYQPDPIQRYDTRPSSPIAPAPAAYGSGGIFDTDNY